MLADAIAAYHDLLAAGGPLAADSQAFLDRGQEVRGLAFGDFDGDGRVDVVTTSLAHTAEIWMNRSPAAGHWLDIALEGTKSNRDGIGARIQVDTRSGFEYNHMTTSVGYASSSYGPVHFGLGADEMAESVVVHWPSGVVQTLKNVRGDRVLRVKEGQPPIVVSARDENEQSRFVAEHIEELRDEGLSLNEIAVLFRASSHSFDLEIELGKHGIPFRKFGGIKFAESTTSTTKTYDQTSVASGINVGGNTKITAKETVKLVGSEVNTGGDLDVKATDVKLLAAQDIHTSSTTTTTTSVGLSAESENKAGARASADAKADSNDMSARANAGIASWSSAWRKIATASGSLSQWWKMSW